MLLSFFIQRLVLCLIAGLIFILAFRRLGASNPIANAKSTAKLKWLYISLYVLAALQFIAFCIFVSVIDFPDRQLIPIFPPDGIIRSSGSYMIWGMPNMGQRSSFTFFIGTFACLGFAQYFKNFIPSPSKWWGKVLKFFWYILIWMLYVNCTDFHYFDFPEFVKTILFAVAIWICFSRRLTPKQNKKVVMSESSAVGMVEDDILPVSDIVKETTSFTVFCEGEDLTKDDVEKSMPIDSVTPSDFTVPQYCRYCGAKIESDSKFCKYCGKSTGTGRQNMKGLFYQLKEKVFHMCNGILPKFKFKKPSLKRSQTVNIPYFNYSIPIAIVCLCIGIVGTILYSHYAFWHSWNTYYFRVSSVGEWFVVFLLSSIAIFVFGVLSILFNLILKKTKYQFVKALTYCFCFLASLGCLGTIVGVIYTAVCYDGYLTSYRLDEALTDETSPLYDESWKLYSKSFDDYSLERLSRETFDMVQEEAYKGNRFAQNILGHHYLRYKKWLYDRTYAEPDYERAFAWFKKSADNGHANSQRMTGLFYLGVYDFIDSIDGYEDREKRLGQAAHYLSLASDANDEIALYYMGILSVRDDEDKAFEYWERGAKLGEDRCRRCIETHSIPIDDVNKYVPMLIQSVFVEHPTVLRKNNSSIDVISVSLNKDNTTIELSASYWYGAWIQINKKTYIEANGQKYVLERTEGISIAPQKTYFDGYNETKVFKLIFPPIPLSTKSIDLIEPNGSNWKLYGIQIQ